MAVFIFIHCFNKNSLFLWKCQHSKCNRKKMNTQPAFILWLENVKEEEHFCTIRTYSYMHCYHHWCRPFALQVCHFVKSSTLFKYESKVTFSFYSTVFSPNASSLELKYIRRQSMVWVFHSNCSCLKCLLLQIQIEKACLEHFME